ncbi:hypothetical protein EV127DRAFT_495120 [Xylaria flabelliformis]|nr:hypothetical protein EV127DRAFT_495120 [Xylaria flabelliformis]
MRTKMPSWLVHERRITKIHEDWLTATTEGGLDPATILENSVVFGLGTMKSSILHQMSERWSVDLEPLFRAVMTEGSRRDDNSLKLYLLKDGLGRTILDRSPTEKTKKTFVKFFFKNYAHEANELIKSNPELLVFLLSMWRQIDWSLICQGLREVLPEPMKEDKDLNTFLHLVVRFPLRSRREDDGELVESVVSKVIEAEPRTLFVLNRQGKSVYQWCIEAMKETSDVRPHVDSSDCDNDDVSDSDTSVGHRPGSSMSNKTDRPGGNDNDIHMRKTRTGALGKGPKSAETTTEILSRISNMLKEQIFRFGESVDQIRQLTALEGKEPEIELDFSELGDIKDSTVLSRFVRLGDLHIVELLRNVKLPANKTNEPVSLKARQDAISDFFKYIKVKYSLKKILRLQVDELVDHPCTDALIELALSGINIDTLDWRKTDMCAQMVVNVVPNVQSLHLYCSGNRGFLLNWSASDALPLLPNLKKLYITVLEDRVEPRESIENYIDEFDRRLHEHISSNRRIDVKYSFQEARGIAWSSCLPGGGNLSMQHELSDTNDMQSWMDKLKEFCEYISREIVYGQPIDRFPIVAIVDDGVSMVEFQSGKGLHVGGRSFISTPSNESKPWFFSTTGHGTTTAKIISSLSPKVRFLVARTNTGIGSQEKSITEALKWCIAQRADIICIGSALDESPDQSIDPNLLSSLDEAINRGTTVLMPAIEPHKGEPNERTSFFPNGVLRFAASRWNESVELPPPPEADFTLIDDISRVLSNGDGEGIPEFINGNSVSTAIATSLAASILICGGLHVGAVGSFGGEGMKKIFRSLLGSGNSKMILTTKLARLKSLDQHQLATHFADVARDTQG